MFGQKIQLSMNRVRLFCIDVLCYVRCLICLHLMPSVQSLKSRHPANIQIQKTGAFADF